LVVDAGTKFRDSLSYPTAFMFACLCHDLGKPVTTAITDGRITSYGHEEAGEKIAKDFMSRLTNNVQLIDQVSFIVGHHLLPANWYLNKPIKKSTGIKLYRKLESLGLDYRYIAYITYADNMGGIVQPTYSGRLHDNLEKGRWFEDVMKSLTVGPEPTKMLNALVNGTDLINLGLKPSPRFREILESAYTFQVDNNITDKEMVLKFIKDSFGIVTNPQINLKRVVSILKTIPGVRSIELFGSRARGTHKLDSDYDIMVWIEPGVEIPNECFKMAFDLPDIFDIKFADDTRYVGDLMWVTDRMSWNNEYDPDEGNQGTPISGEIIKDMKVLWRKK
jgi:predicted nucleotidyltransferase